MVTVIVIDTLRIVITQLLFQLHLKMQINQISEMAHVSAP